jgi:cell division protein FtsB
MSSQSISFRPAALIRQMPWSVDGKAAVGLLLLLVIFSLVGWLYLSQASYLTATAFRVEELRAELEAVQRTNAALGLEIAQLESLPRIEQRARELGFGPPEEVRYLVLTGLPATVNEYQMASTTPGEPPLLSWWPTLIDQVSTWLVGETLATPGGL